jgi:sulfite reductase alpha subunit-like flavoprotein
MAPNVSLVYGSFFMGDCKRDIKTIHSTFPKIAGLEVAEPVEGSSFDFDSLKDCKFLIICTSSQLGMPPPNFAQFAHQLLRAAQNPDKPLKHLQHAVFGNGDETYFKTYMNMPRYMDLLLEKAGSKRFFARGENGEPFADLDTDAVSCKEWAPLMWKAAEKASTTDVAPVKWDACWEKQEPHHHKNITEWDLDRLQKHAAFKAKPTMYAKL